MEMMHPLFVQQISVLISSSSVTTCSPRDQSRKRQDCQLYKRNTFPDEEDQMISTLSEEPAIGPAGKTTSCSQIAGIFHLLDDTTEEKATGSVENYFDTLDLTWLRRLLD